MKLSLTRQLGSVIAACLFCLALWPATGSWAQQAPAPTSLPAANDALEDIVVTATRRQESLSRIPLSVSAFSAEQMELQGIKDIDDLVRQASGVTFFRGAYGTATISIRGIGDNSSSGGVGASTTAVYLDDTPIQPRSAPLAFTTTNPYPSVFDLERVEVLRGPQGTLFGSGALGGAIRFITPTPSLTQSSFYGRSELSFTRGGAPSFDVGVAGGGPLIRDVLGIRLSVDERRDGGWIDRVQRYQLVPQERNANWIDTKTLRLALRYAPTPQLTITPSYYTQAVFTNDEGLYWEGLSNPGAGHFVDAVAPQPDSDRLHVGAVKVEYDFGNVVLTSNTSLLSRRNRNQYDVTANALELTPAGGFPLLLNLNLSPLRNDFTAPAFDLNQQQSFVQEVRLQSADPKAKFTWQTGIFFQRMRSVAGGDQITGQTDLDNIAAFVSQGQYTTYQALLLGAYGITIPMIDGNVTYRYVENNRDLQTALFGEAGLKLTDTLTATLGARVSSQSVNSLELVGGPASGVPAPSPGNDLAGSTASQRDTPFVPKVSLSYLPDDDNLYYGAIAKGFRSGGPIHALAVTCASSLQVLGLDPANPPKTYKPDSLWSYELGAKNTLLEHTLAISSSIYLIKWSGIQQSTFLNSCGQAFPFNGGNVTSRGFDLQATTRLNASLRLNATLAYTEAHYNQNLMGETGPIIRAGDSIGNPAANTPAPWTASLAPYYDFTWNGHSAFVTADYTFSSRHYHRGATEDPGTVQYQVLERTVPVIQNLDLRTGLSFGRLEAALFVKNAFNAHPETRTSYGYPNSQWLLDSTLRPRTLGASMTYRTD